MILARSSRRVRVSGPPPNKGECKEPSTLPFKQFLAGASPVAFSNSNVNAKRPEHSDSQSDPIEFKPRHVRQLCPRSPTWQEATRLERVQCQFESDRGYQSVWVEAEAVEADVCETSVSGFKSRRSNQIRIVAEHSGCRLQNANTLVRFQSMRPIIRGVSQWSDSRAWNSEAARSNRASPTN